jgi:hypothetical protein
VPLLLRRPNLRRLAALAAFALVVACGEAPVPAGEGYHVVTLRSTSAVAAFDVVLSHASDELAYVGTGPSQHDVLVLGSSAGATTRLGGVLLGARDGALVEVVYRRLVADAQGVTVVAAAGFTEEGGPSGAFTIEERQTATRPAQESGYEPAARATTFPIASAVMPPLPLAAYADGPYGDVTGDGSVDVRDALAARRIADGSTASPTARERLHAGAHPEPGVGGIDVLTLLRKAVDADAAAMLRVFPAALSYAELQAGAVVLVANAGNRALSPAVVGGPGVTVGLVAGAPGELAAYAVDVAAGAWARADVAVTAAGATARIPVGTATFLVAGQSNAAGWGRPLLPSEAPDERVRMLGNDYLWKTAVEPLDSTAGQIDHVSREPNGDVYHSFGLALGKGVADGAGRQVVLIPSALGGSTLADWSPAADRRDRSTLFGSAAFRADTSAAEEGGPVTALVWYQGEQEAIDAARRAAFVTSTGALMAAFEQEFGPGVVLYVQLGRAVSSSLNAQYQVVREHQRRMETGAGVDTGTGAPAPRPAFHMVVAHDLPLNAPSDDPYGVHLDAQAQRELGRRLALAYRQHALGEDVDGTGPRLVAIEQAGSTVRVRTTHVVSDHPTYDGGFSVRDANGVVDIASLGRDPDDPTAIRIILATPPAGSVTVRYMPVAGTNGAPNAVRSTDGLPLPAFGTHGEP